MRLLSTDLTDALDALRTIPTAAHVVECAIVLAVVRDSAVAGNARKEAPAMAVHLSVRKERSTGITSSNGRSCQIKSHDLSQM